MVDNAKVWLAPSFSHSKLSHSTLNREGVGRLNEPEDLPINIIFGMLSGKKA